MHDDVTCGEIEIAHPVYLGSQDTFYVSNMKGEAPTNQQALVDTYSKVAYAEFYTTETQIIARRFA